MTAPAPTAICEDFLAGFCMLDDKCTLLHREVDLEAGEAIPDAAALAAEAATPPVAAAGEEGPSPTDAPPVGTPDTGARPTPDATPPAVLATEEPKEPKPRAVCEDYATGFCMLEDKCPLLHKDEAAEGEPDENGEPPAADADAGDAAEVETFADESSETEADSKRAALQREIDELPDEPEDISDTDEEDKVVAKKAAEKKKGRKEVGVVNGEAEEEVVVNGDANEEKEKDEVADTDAGAMTDAEVKQLMNAELDKLCGKEAGKEKDKDMEERPHATEKLTPSKKQLSPPPAVPPKRSRKLSSSRRRPPAELDEITPAPPPDEITPAPSREPQGARDAFPARAGLGYHRSDARDTGSLNRQPAPRYHEQKNQPGEHHHDEHPHLHAAKLGKEEFDKVKYHCHVCKRDCNTPSNYDSHIRGKAHKQAALKAKFASRNEVEEVVTVGVVGVGGGGGGGTGGEEMDAVAEAALVEAWADADATPPVQVQNAVQPAAGASGGAPQTLPTPSGGGRGPTNVSERVPAPPATSPTADRLAESARAARSDARVPPMGGPPQVPAALFVEDRVPAPAPMDLAAVEPTPTAISDSGARHLADGVAEMNIDTPPADAVDANSSFSANGVPAGNGHPAAGPGGPPGAPLAGPVGGSAAPWVGSVPHNLPASGRLDPPPQSPSVEVVPGHPDYRGPGALMPARAGAQHATLVSAGTATETKDPALLERMTLSHWRELKEWCFSSGEFETLTFKILQEFLLSPSVGIGGQHLGPLSDLIDKTVRFETYSDGSRYAVFDSFPLALSGDGPPDARLTKAEADAAACFGDNLMYTFWLRSKEETGRDRLRRDEELPPRGTFPRTPGVPVVYEAHDESVPADRLFQSMGRH